MIGTILCFILANLFFGFMFSRWFGTQNGILFILAINIISLTIFCILKSIIRNSKGNSNN